MKRFACVAAVCLVAILGVGVRVGSGAAGDHRRADSKLYARVQLRTDARPQVGRVLSAASSATA